MDCKSELQSMHAPESEYVNAPHPCHHLLRRSFAWKTCAAARSAIAPAAYAAAIIGVDLPNQPAKSRAGLAPLSLRATYQKVRKLTMKVLGLALTMPSMVAAAAVKVTPIRSARAEV